MAQGPTRRRRVASGAKRTVAGAKRAAELELDDRPLSLRTSRDQKWLIACLPHEICIVHAQSLRLERSIEVDKSRPCVSEGTRGELWIGGRHLHRCDMFNGKPSKVGSKLGGYVDEVALLRPDLLCGLGPKGEILFRIDPENSEVAHQRHASHRGRLSLLALPDERALLATGQDNAWIIDPSYPSGYTKLQFRTGGEPSPARAPIDRVGLTLDGRSILAARDASIAWTSPSGRIEGEAHVRLSSRDRPALAMVGDEHWIYVLRPNGRLQRFWAGPRGFEHTPPSTSNSRSQPRNPPRPRPSSSGRVPEAQECRLPRAPTSMTMMHVAAPPPSDDDSLERRLDQISRTQRLYFGAPKADGYLGILWTCTANELDWRPLSLTERAPYQSPAAKSETAMFVAIRSKLGDGPTLREISVDSVLSGRPGYYVSHGSGDPLDWSTRAGPVDSLLAGDGLLFGAMLRMAHGTVRPALVYQPATTNHDEAVAPAELTVFVWGDEPRGWMPLHTPDIRRQRWARSELFPFIAALASDPPEGLGGERVAIPKRWFDRELFASMAKECKTRMEVLW